MTRRKDEKLSKIYSLNQSAFERFDELKAKEKELEEAKASAIADHDQRITEARNHTACFLNGVAAILDVPPSYLFIEEYGQFQPNRKRKAKQKTPARKRKL